MKLFIFLSLVVSTFSIQSFAEDKKRPIKTPYTLKGMADECSLTVLEIGKEKSFNKKRPMNPHRKFYIDVTIDSIPDSIFHLKSSDGKTYRDRDGNSGMLLVVRGGASIHHPVPLSRGTYTLFNRRRPVLSCKRLKLVK